MTEKGRELGFIRLKVILIELWKGSGLKNYCMLRKEQFERKGIGF